MQFESAEMARACTGAGICNPIEEVEAMANKDDGGMLIMPFAPEALEVFCRSDDDFRMMTPVRCISRTSLTGVLSAVRNIVLQWSLKLEEEGIVGEGMAFSESEKRKASESGGIHIQNFSGILGDVRAGNLQVGDFGQVHAQLKSAGIPQSERNELETLLDKLKSAAPEEKPRLSQKAMDWLGRNAKNLGALAGVIGAWFGIKNASE